ncbi:MAG: hypothetical protein HY855_02105 [Burkholderiales bacterium]|nr:hypothetical protein [Burkholderiales bacterium]
MNPPGARRTAASAVHRPRLQAARRRLLGAGLGLLAGGAAATPPPPRGSRPDPAAGAQGGPARMLLVEFRCLPQNPGPEPAPAPVRGERSVGTAGATTPASGSVVVGTRDRRDTGPAVSWRSSAAQPQPAVVLRLQVANGQLARHRVAHEWREPVLDFAWLGGTPSPTRGPSGASAGMAVALREQVHLTLQELQVLPRWAGGGQPVQVWLLARQAGPRRADGSADGMAEGVLETTLHIPPGQWVSVARSVDPLAAGAGASGEPATLAWQIRVTPQPE